MGGTEHPAAAVKGVLAGVACFGEVTEVTQCARLYGGCREGVAIVGADGGSPPPLGGSGQVRSGLVLAR